MRMRANSFTMITTAALMVCASGLAGRVQAKVAAGPVIATQSALFVEHTDRDNTRRLEPATQLAPGDRVVTVLTWYRMGGATGRDGSFVITNAVPTHLAYQGSASVMQEVSVDGGRTWGRLGTLRIEGRLASAQDVTHMRWRIPGTDAPQGEIAYAGIVR